MNKIKKILSFVLVLFSLCLLVACTNETTTVTTTKEGYVTLPDLTDKTTQEVDDCLKQYTDLNYSLKVKDDLYYGDKEGEYQYEMFYGYAGSNAAGTEFDLTKKLNVYVTAYNLYDTIDALVEANPSLKEAYSDVTLDGKTYTGKSFLKTAVGEVTVTSYVDGDTTRFKDASGEVISLRYLGVDTPESTASFEAWGKAASAYTKSCLENAKKIVLEAETAGQQDSNGRYLGWVWYQTDDDAWHLLNLELIAFCYSKDKADSDSTYGEIATDIGTLIGNTHRKVWGEADPDFDYSTTPKEISIKELRTNFGQYYSRKVTVTGVVAMMDGKAPVIVDPETGYGIYFYVPSWQATGTYNLVVGNKVKITGVATYYGIEETDLDNMDEDLGKGSPQLTDFKDGCVELISEGNTVSPTLLEIASLTAASCGMYAEIKNLTVTDTYMASTESGFSITCQDANNNEIVIRVDSSHFYLAGTQEDGINFDDFKVGDTIQSVIGYISYYSGYQINLVSKQDIK